MAARAVRRTFAAPFVVTLAAAPLATHAEQAPADPPKARPAPKKPAPKPTVVDRERTWHVTKAKDTCTAFPEGTCPKVPPGQPIPPCNPPPPLRYACKDALPEGAHRVRQPAKADFCERVVSPVKCDPGTRCNPPRPQRVTCPSR